MSERARACKMYLQESPASSTRTGAATAAAHGLTPGEASRRGHIGVDDACRPGRGKKKKTRGIEEAGRRRRERNGREMKKKIYKNKTKGCGQFGQFDVPGPGANNGKTTYSVPLSPPLLLLSKYGRGGSSGRATSHERFFFFFYYHYHYYA